MKQLLLRTVTLSLIALAGASCAKRDDAADKQSAPPPVIATIEARGDCAKLRELHPGYRMMSPEPIPYYSGALDLQARLRSNLLGLGRHVTQKDWDRFDEITSSERETAVFFAMLEAAKPELQCFGAGFTAEVVHDLLESRKITSAELLSEHTRASGYAVEVTTSSQWMPKETEWLLKAEYEPSLNLGELLTDAIDEEFWIAGTGVQPVIVEGPG